MIEKTGPTIYKGESIYNTGAGGGSHPLLIFGMSDKINKDDGWIFGNTCVKSYGGAKYGVTTTLARYGECPSISNVNKIEFTFKCRWTNSVGSNYRFYRGNLDVGYQLFVANIGTDNKLSFYLCNNGSGSAVKTYTNIFTLSNNLDYEFKNILDVENGKLQLYINDTLIINDTVNIADLNLNYWVPCIGFVVDTVDLTLPRGFVLYRDSFTYKLDGVEQIPLDNLE